ncbi:MAG: phage terminase large subunit family protein [bacterium]|nr:phage terminase large subunit family protein [bacterium]
MRGVYATVGRAGVGRPIISAPSNRKQGQAPLPVKLFTVAGRRAKGILYSWPARGAWAWYCHFPEGDGYEQEYFKQLTAEKRVIRYTKGFPKAEWIKTRARNEALDCRVQAHAALCLLNPLWKAVEKNLAPRLPFPEQAIAEPSDGTVARHPIGMVRLANSEQLRRIAARDSWVTRRRR